MSNTIKTAARAALDYLRMPGAARRMQHRDRRGLPTVDPGIEASVGAAIQWLGDAQDLSASKDGGCARDYSLLTGWATSYPETTGYIVPTLIDWGKAHPESDAMARARRMLDWLVAIQMPGGGFQGGKIDAPKKVPVTFNTGQILLGLSAGVVTFGDSYRAPMQAAADWLRDTQDADGCWRKHGTPFAEPGDKTYETHVAWGLFEAERVEPGHGYGEAGMRQVRWAMTQQQDNGWLANCCLRDPARPLTHTLGYALRGFMEAHRLTGDPMVLDAAIKEARGLMSAVGPDGFLAGELRADWSPAAPWACLTGSVQIAHSLIMIYQVTGETAFLDSARRLNRYVRRTVILDGPVGVRGGIRGAFPVDGNYGRFQFLNWAAKFFIDANLLERSVTG